jgi:hypothetical protein
MQGSAHMTGDEATASACSLVLASWFVRARYSSSASFALLSARSRPSRSSKERSFAWHTQPPQPPSQPARHSEARARSHARTQQQVARTQRRTLLTHLLCTACPWGAATATATASASASISFVSLSLSYSRFFFFHLLHLCHLFVVAFDRTDGRKPLLHNSFPRPRSLRLPLA